MRNGLCYVPPEVMRRALDQVHTAEVDGVEHRVKTISLNHLAFECGLEIEAGKTYVFGKGRMPTCPSCRQALGLKERINE